MSYESPFDESWYLSKDETVIINAGGDSIAFINDADEKETRLLSKAYDLYENLRHLVSVLETKNCHFSHDDEVTKLINYIEDNEHD